MKARRTTVFLLIIAILFLFCSCGGSAEELPEEGEVHITFLDVGQADCALIRTSDAVVVVDTGDVSTDGAELLAHLRRLNIEKIDLLILTHPHEDHIGGAPSLLREHEVAECLMPDLLENSAIFRETLSALKDENCVVTRAEAEVLREYGNLSVEVLSPTKEFYSTINDAGAVIRVKFGEFAFLFMGDVSGTVEEELVALYPDALRADILKVAHHGSALSTSRAFLSAVAPQHAVISCAAGNEYGVPHPDVLARLSNAGVSVHRTDTEGTITFRAKDGKIEIMK